MLDPDHLLLTVQCHYGRQLNFVKQLSGLDVTSWLVRDVTSEKTEKFVIKIAPHKKEKDFSKELSYRQCMMQRLLDSGPICPRLVPTVSGQTLCLYTCTFVCTRVHQTTVSTISPQLPLSNLGNYCNGRVVMIPNMPSEVASCHDAKYAVIGG